MALYNQLGGKWGQRRRRWQCLIVWSARHGEADSSHPLLYLCASEPLFCSIDHILSWGNDAGGFIGSRHISWVLLWVCWVISCGVMGLNFFSLFKIIASAMYRYIPILSRVCVCARAYVCVCVCVFFFLFSCTTRQALMFIRDSHFKIIASLFGLIIIGLFQVCYY